MNLEVGASSPNKAVGIPEGGLLARVLSHPSPAPRRAVCWGPRGNRFQPQLRRVQSGSMTDPFVVIDGVSPPRGACARGQQPALRWARAAGGQDASGAASMLTF